MVEERPLSANDRLFRLLLALVALAPLPLAANRPWSWSLLCLLVGLIALAWGGLVASQRVRPGLEARCLWPLAAPFLAALAWAFLQTQSFLPSSWLHPIWAEAAVALASPPSPAVSADPELTRIAVMRLLAYGAVFLLAAQMGRHRKRARLGLRTLAWATLGYCAYGLTAHMLGVEHILWLEKSAYLGDATGTFVSRNAFGSLAGLGVLLCLGVATDAIHSSTPTRSRVDRIERLITLGLPWGLAACICFLALLASHSRGALLATGASLVVLLACLIAGRLIRPLRAFVLAAMGAIIVTAFLATSGNVTLSRLAGEGDLTGDRPNLVRLTIEAIGDAPLTGHGLGAFDRAFRPYRDLSLPRPVRYDYAHNFWLEVVIDLGIPAACALFASPILAIGICARGLRIRRRDQVYPAVAIAVASLLGLHGMTDFTIQMPALAALLSFLLGVGYAQSRSTESGETISAARGCG